MSEALQTKLGIRGLTRQRIGFHTLGTILSGFNAAQAVLLPGRWSGLTRGNVHPLN